MTRVALIFEFPTLNGGERSMLAVVDRLRAASADWDFTAIAPDAGRLSGALAARGIPNRTLAMRDENGKRFPRETVLCALRDLLDDVRPDLLHANSLSMGRLTGALGDHFPIPRLAHLRDIMRLSNSTVRDLNRNDRTICVSAATRKFHVAQGLEERKSHVLYNGVDCDAFQPQDGAAEIRGALGIPLESQIALTVGQIGLRKGHDILAAAAVSLREKLPNLHFIVVGERHSVKEESIEFERNIVSRFRDAGMSNRLHLLGFRDDVAAIMKTADLLVHPAHQEPLGRVLLEAAASGLPIIATDVGGTAEILESGVSAELLPPGDPARLAESIHRLLHSPETLRSYAAKARQVIESRFTIAIAADNLAAIWREAL